MKAWTYEEHKELVAYAIEGLSASQIGRKLGRSRNSICGRCDRTFIRLIATNPGARSPNPGGRKAHKRTEEAVQGFSDTLGPEAEEAAHTASMCQYIDGGISRRGNWCMKPKAQGSYCQEHYDLCHNTGAPRLGWK